jgi:hypothetical protein
MTLRAHLDRWINTTLTQRLDNLKGHALCPFAKDAWATKQVQVTEVHADLFGATSAAIEVFLKNPVGVHIVGCSLHLGPTREQTRDFVIQARNKFFDQDLWFLYDHPENPEPFVDFTVNQGEYVLIFLQKLSELVRASELLERQGYYTEWPQEYFTRVVGERRCYWEQLRQLSRLRADNRIEDFAQSITYGVGGAAVSLEASILTASEGSSES